MYQVRGFPGASNEEERACQVLRIHLRAAVDPISSKVIPIIAVHAGLSSRIVCHPILQERSREKSCLKFPKWRAAASSPCTGEIIELLNDFSRKSMVCCSTSRGQL